MLHIVFIAVVQIPDSPRKQPLASIYFRPEIFDKKSPDSLWNLGLSDLHLLRSEKVAGAQGFEPRKCQSQSLMPYRLATPQY